jgi:hypothetical protein
METKNILHILETIERRHTRISQRVNTAGLNSILIVIDRRNKLTNIRISRLIRENSVLNTLRMRNILT